MSADVKSAATVREKLAYVGWVSPAGEHHACGWSDHDVYAQEVLGKRVSELEADGWVRVTVYRGALDALWAPGCFPTEEQAAWLLAHAAFPLTSEAL